MHYQMDTNVYTVVSFPHVFSEKKNGRGIYFDPSIAWSGDIFTHKSHWVSEIIYLIIIIESIFAKSSIRESS